MISRHRAERKRRKGERGQKAKVGSIEAAKKTRRLARKNSVVAKKRPTSRPGDGNRTKMERKDR